jgi:membrane fusion protein (multidrug efflux system)
MILRLLFSIIVITSLSIITSCSSARKKEAEQQQKTAPGARPLIRADAYIVKTKLLLDNIEIPGSLVANETTEIHPEVAGRITGIYFKEGAFVNKGSLLVKLNDADLQAQKRKLEVQLKVAQQNESRSSQLLKIQGISRQDYEAIALQVSNANADLAVVQTQIEKTNIRAPFSGKLGLRMVSLGAYISPTTTLTTISQMNQLKIDFTVPERYIPQVGMGQFVNFRVDGSDRVYAARVTATDPNIVQNTRTLQVRATVQGNQEGLVPGNFAKVTLDFKPDPNAIVVPSQAIIPQARGKKVYVYDNGTAKFVDVTTGLRDSANVQVTSGLKAGDTILITGLLTLRPNGKVMLGRVVNDTKQAADTSSGNRDAKKQPQIQ